jgi:hypothetical protein
MSLLPGDTYANAGRALWAVAGSGGGGGNTLASPASVTPDGNGDTDLTLQSQGVGQSSVSLLSPGIASLSVSGTNVSYVSLSSGVNQTALTNFHDGILRIQSDSLQSTQPNVAIDTNTQTITLGGSVVQVGTSPSIVVNSPLTYSASAGAPIAGFPPIVLSSTGGPFIQGDNTVALGGLARGLYVMIGDSGASTNQADLDSRFNSIFQIDPAQTCSGGAGGADTGWNLSPNGTGGLTLNLTNAPTGAFSVKCFPLYLF